MEKVMMMMMMMMMMMVVAEIGGQAEVKLNVRSKY